MAPYPLLRTWRISQAEAGCAAGLPGGAVSPHDWRRHTLWRISIPGRRPFRSSTRLRSPRARRSPSAPVDLAPYLLLRLPGLLEKEQPLGRDLVAPVSPSMLSPAIRRPSIRSSSVSAKGTIAALAIEVDGAVVAEPLEPAAEGAARVVLIGRHPPRSSTQTPGKSRQPTRLQAVRRAPASHEGIVALEEFGPGGVVPQRRNPFEQLGISRACPDHEPSRESLRE